MENPAEIEVSVSTICEWIWAPLDQSTAENHQK